MNISQVETVPKGLETVPKGLEPSHRFSEIRGNLFDDVKNSLGHCVSRDFKMMKGIAYHFRFKFGRVDELEKQSVSVGQVAYLKENDRYLFYLVTKDKYYHKPTLKTLQLCLEYLVRLCNSLNVKEISIPRIGCGLDQLSWDVVKMLLIKIVCPVVKVNVYSLDD